MNLPYLIDEKIRKLSPRECARVQGFPDSFILNPSISQSYKQFGNSVSVDVLQYILIEISKILHPKERQTKPISEINYA